ncbi:MAG: response regulator transcription factor [Actinomycetales bacterium]|nr:response regulator transcription factor [Actinomycetales bacterium]
MTETRNQRILLVEDHQLFASAIVSALADDERLSVLHVTDGEAAIDAYTHGFNSEDPADAFDMVLCDLGLPGVDGLEVLRRLKDLDPDVKIVVLTGSEERADVLACNIAGAFGYLTKAAATGHELLWNVRRALSGTRVYDVEIASMLISQSHGEEDSGPQLTKRELEVLQGIAKGLQAKEQAADLFVSVATVRSYQRNLYTKLGVNDRGGAVAEGFRLGLLR